MNRSILSKLFLFLFLGLFMSMSQNSHAGSRDGDPTTVDYVDIERYMGKWYEIARFPQYFQRNCGASIAEYTLDKDGSVKVVNSCKRLDNPQKIKSAKARAFVVDEQTNAKLKVSFVPILRRWGLFAADYWIFDLGPDYEYALVGGPDRKSLWILSRTPTLSELDYQHLIEVATEQGFDATRLVRSPVWDQ